MDFLILDSKETISSSNDIKSRASAIRGFLPFMKSIKFTLNDDLKINDIELDQIKNENQYCFFGFTWLIYQIIKENKNNKKIKNNLSKLNSPFILHLGGWKKLTDINITREEFYKEISEFFNTEEDKIIDIYGMTEQLGTVYPDCKFGNKHVSMYSDIIIRNPLTLKNECNKTNEKKRRGRPCKNVCNKSESIDENVSIEVERRIIDGVEYLITSSCILLDSNSYDILGVLVDNEVILE